jgi:hypothetical protein
MRKLFRVIFAIALTLWRATAFLSRDQSFCSQQERFRSSVIVRQNPTRPTAAVAGNLNSQDQGLAVKSRVPGKSQGSGRTGTQKEASFESLFRGKTPKEMDAWMDAQAIIRNMNETAQTIPLNEWSSHDETNFIRSLRDHKAYRAIVVFTRRLAHKNVFVYTAAIASLATCEEYQEAALQLLDDMEEHNVRPSPYTFAALFQATNRPEKARLLQVRLKRDYPSVTWTPPVWEAAMYACGRGAGSWAIAKEFLAEMKQESLFPTARTYLALFQVCSTTANVSQSMEILRDLLKADSPVAVSDQLVPASGARRYRFAPLPATTHRLGRFSLGCKIMGI